MIPGVGKLFTVHERTDPRFHQRLRFHLPVAKWMLAFVVPV